jgi:hypothetical protein
MKKYNNFLQEKIKGKRLEYMDMIISYLNNNTNYTYAQYEEHFKVYKNKYKYDSIIFLMTNMYNFNERKAIRFNFANFNLHSIDMWDNLIFNLKEGRIYNKPSWEMLVPNSIAGVMDDIVAFVDGDFSLYESIDENIKQSEEEDVESEILNYENIDLDIFEAIKYNTLQVAFNDNTNAFILSGLAGMGKTYDVTHTLDEVRKEYQYFKGNSSPAGLYELLFKYRKELIVLDDMDDALNDKNTADILKSVLDTGKKRILDRRVKGYFDAVGLTDEEIEEEYQKTGKLPNRFEFTGSIIFITNLSEDDFDKAVYTRTISLDVRLEKEEILNRIKQIMPNMLPTINMDMKLETLSIMNDLLSKYIEKAPLNLRTYYHCLNFRVSNDFDTTINGIKIPLWQLLIKQFLVRKTKLKDLEEEK